MAGTRAGYLKGRKTNLAKDPDYYKKQASHAGKHSTNRPFRDRDLAKRASIKGVAIRQANAKYKPKIKNLNPKKYNFGEEASYNAKHKQIHRLYGKADHCDNPECPRTSKRFEWSNKSGTYSRDVSDWQQLCSKCHYKYDKEVLGRKKSSGRPRKVPIDNHNHNMDNG